MKRAIGAVLFVIYSIIAITVTVLLLSFNDYRCSEIGGYTIYIAEDDSLEPQYKEGSILLIEQTSDKNVEIGDELLMYKVIDSQEYEIVTRTLENKTQQGRHIVYDVDQDETYDSDYFIGKAEDVKVIEGPWGTILSILESKWGYLFCIVVVSLLLFLQEVFDLIVELKYGGTKGTKAANAANARRVANKKTTTKKATATKTTTAKKSTTTATEKATSVAKTVETATKTVATATKANNSEIGEKEE